MSNSLRSKSWIFCRSIPRPLPPFDFDNPTGIEANFRNNIENRFPNCPRSRIDARNYLGVLIVRYFSARKPLFAKTFKRFFMVPNDTTVFFLSSIFR